MVTLQNVWLKSIKMFRVNVLRKVPKIFLTYSILIKIDLPLNLVIFQILNTKVLFLIKVPHFFIRAIEIGM